MNSRKYTTIKGSFANPTTAFQYMYHYIRRNGVEYSDTKAIFNVGFYILNPMDNEIKTPWRNWNPTYANREWKWYESGNPNATSISKHAPLWKNMMDDGGNVNSNYGYQWQRENQLDKIISKLASNSQDRQCVISLYDGKEIDKYSNDTPCTLTISFQIVHEKVHMTVNMRSNDLWFGFCNDQFCFSKLHQKVCRKLDMDMGYYYHFANNLHIYNQHLNKFLD